MQLNWLHQPNFHDVADQMAKAGPLQDYTIVLLLLTIALQK